MKSQSGAKGAQKDRRVVSHLSPVSLDSESTRSLGALDDDERRIVDCLKSAPAGLTLRQLETKLGAGAVDVGRVLAGLIDRRVVCSLNTLIPSYTLRNPSAGVHAE